MKNYDQATPPKNQIAAELDLFNGYSRQFPESLPLLESALSVIGEFTDSDKPRHGLTRLRLRMPLPRDKQMTAEPSLEEEGMTIVGATMPPETKALLDGVHGLIGAETLRDDHTSDEPRGTVLRKGEYHGRPVYMVEYYDELQGSQNATLGVWIMDEKRAQLSLSDLNDRERREFMDISGIPGGDSLHVIAGHGANRKNYQEIAGILGRTREIVEAAEKPKTPRSKLTKFLSRISMGGGWRS